jgi:hypothetical protein
MFMTLHPIPSEFPYIYEEFFSLSFLSVYSSSLFSRVSYKNFFQTFEKFISTSHSNHSNHSNLFALIFVKIYLH